jgi:hypothetical protein
MKIREFYKSLEFISIFIIGLMMFYVVDIGLFIKSLSVVFNLYAISRAIYKTGRGLTHTAFKSSEGVLFLLNESMLLISCHKQILNQTDYCIYAIIAYAIFSIGRGATKKLRNSHPNNTLMGR